GPGSAERAGGVVREERRDLQRHPSVDAVGALVDGTEEVGGLRQVLERELEEQLLARLAGGHQRADRGVVVAAALDRLVEDGGIRGEPRDRQLVAIVTERAAG